MKFNGNNNDDDDDDDDDDYDHDYVPPWCHSLTSAGCGRIPKAGRIAKVGHRAPRSLALPHLTPDDKQQDQQNQVRINQTYLHGSEQV